jgi:Zn-dependent protease with chaperone function/RNA polymerase subunit RPABC4/transcription elongation factor Spt4
MSSPSPVSVSGLRTFPQLSPSAFQHPDDSKTTSALGKIPGITALVKSFAGGVAEKAARLHHLSECVRLGPNQAVHLYRLFVKAAEILSLSTVPELFVSPDAGINAYAMGMKQYTVVVTRGLVHDMSSMEFMAVIGHELGHVKCGHMVNKTIAAMIAEFGLAGLSKLVPVLGEAALLPVVAHLQYWSRMAEITCDRAALLVVQDPKTVATTLAKLGGWAGSLGDIDFQSLREQGEEYDSLDDDKVSAALKVINMLQSELYLTHPVPIERVRRILLWAESDMYREILDGKYTRIDQSAPELRCEQDGTLLTPSDQFCPMCGSLSPIRPSGQACTYCGYAITVQRSKYCGRCGKPLAAQWE